MFEINHRFKEMKSLSFQHMLLCQVFWGDYIYKILYKFFWSITILVSYLTVDPNHVISLYDFITIIANAISYSVFYGITFTISYCLEKVK